jgi:hypothetical protein
MLLGESLFIELKLITIWILHNSLQGYQSLTQMMVFRFISEKKSSGYPQKPAYSDLFVLWIITFFSGKHCIFRLCFFLEMVYSSLSVTWQKKPRNWACVCMLHLTRLIWDYLGCVILPDPPGKCPFVTSGLRGSEL